MNRFQIFLNQNVTFRGICIGLCILNYIFAIMTSPWPDLNTASTIWLATSMILACMGKEK